MTDLGTTAEFFRRYIERKIPCEAQDRPRRRIVVSCATKPGRSHVYEGAFVGAGYLVIERVTIDGRRTPGAAVLPFVRAVAAGEMP